MPGTLDEAHMLFLSVVAVTSFLITHLCMPVSLVPDSPRQPVPTYHTPDKPVSTSSLSSIIMGLLSLVALTIATLSAALPDPEAQPEPADSVSYVRPKPAVPPCKWSPSGKGRCCCESLTGGTDSSRRGRAVP